MSYLKWNEPWNGYSVPKDTGLCNRIFHWELGYEINKINNFEFTILVENIYWPELNYLSFPYTEGSKYRGDKFKGNSRLFNSNVLEKDNFKLDVSIDWSPTCGYNFSNFFCEKYDSEILRPLQLIDIKNKILKKNIFKNVENVVGIHIRKGLGINRLQDSNKLSLAQYKRYVRRCQETLEYRYIYPYIEDKFYLDIMEKIININPDQKFYISSDVGKEQLCEFYDKYNIVDHTTILNKIYSEVDLSKNYPRPSLNKKCLQDVVDLFSLSYCKFSILYPMSTWSDFAFSYKNNFCLRILIDKFDENVYIRAMS